MTIKSDIGWSTKRHRLVVKATSYLLQQKHHMTKDKYCIKKLSEKMI
ncbi:11779_t:CDS:2, partial [Gigaspora rosea]